jgi:3-deoxy-D-manno-octulosonate 8-phosphate phosphatase (KDO 8-P phosphatase)
MKPLMKLPNMSKLTREELRSRLFQVKLLALDVDGVLTDGGIYILDSGEEFKRFNVKDGLGLKQVMATGIEVAILTANASTAVAHRMKTLGISHVFIGVKDKEVVLRELCQTLEIELDRVAYIGDDLADLGVLKLVGLPITVADSVPAVKSVAYYITQQGGGQGAVREICDLLLGEIY